MWQSLNWQNSGWRHKEDEEAGALQAFCAAGCRTRACCFSLSSSDRYAAAHAYANTQPIYYTDPYFHVNTFTNPYANTHADP